MDAHLEVLYSRACDKVDRGDVDEARKVLKGNPELLASLERKIKPPNEAGILKEIQRLAKLAAFHRGRAWVYQLEATQVCHYSRTLLKDPQIWLLVFLERQCFTRSQTVFFHAKFFDYYHEGLVPVKEIVHSNWTEYKEKKPKMRFKDFTQFKAITAPHEFNPQPKVPSRYERPWVI
jgi:hypothetical protein